MKIKIWILTGIFLLLNYTIQAQVVLSTPDTPNKQITAPASIQLKPGYKVSAQSGTYYRAFIDSDGDGFADQDIPPGTSPENGGQLQSFADTSGEINVSNSGTLQYRVAIALPPGIKDIAPQISLEYSSGGYNGMAGYGWNITGISSIARVNSNLYLDGGIDGNLTNYSLDGQRLLLKNTGSGEFGKIYQTENYSNLQIQASINSANNLANYFKVTSPDGVVVYYGNSEDSKGLSDYLIKKWINPQGNVIEYSYITNGNTKLISEIKWGYNQNINTNYSNTIKFYYKERTRPEYSYIKGQKIANYKILDRVEVYTSTQLFKKYVFSHVQNDLGYDFVSQVQEFNADNQPANPIKFNHTFTKDEVNVLENTSNTMDLTEEKSLVAGDFDGDGRLDYLTTKLYNRNFVGGPAYVKSIFNGKLFEPGNSIRKQVNFPLDVSIIVSALGGGLSAAADHTIKSDVFSIITTDNQGKLNQKNSLLVADHDKINYKVNLKIYDYNGNDFQSTREFVLPVKPDKVNVDLSSCHNGDPKSVVSDMIEGDFNGDGISEIMVFNRVNTYYDEWQEPNPEELPTGNNHGFPGAGVWDGRCMSIPMDEYENNIYIYNTDSTIPESNRLAKIENTPVFDDNGQGLISSNRYVIDFNGDGRSDVIFFSGENYKVVTFNYKSENLLEPEVLAQGKIPELILNMKSGESPASYEYSKEVLVGDLNGDGKSDLMIPLGNGNKNGSSPNKSDWVACLSTGTGFEKVYYYNFVEYKPSTKDYYEQRLHLRSNYLLDINGDGKSDFVSIYRDYFKVTGRIGDHDVIMTVDAYKNLTDKTAATPRFEHTYNFYKRTESPTMPIPFAGDYRIEAANFEVLLTQNDNVWAFDFRKDNQKDQLMSLVTEGSGLVYKPIYKSLGNYTTSMGTANDVYSSSNSELYPFVEVKNLPKSYVVEKLQKLGPQGYDVKQEFKYFGLTMHSRGMGMLGFKKMGRTNWTASDGTTPVFWQTIITDPLKRGAIIEQSLIRGNNPFTSNDFINIKSTEYQNVALSGIYKILPTKEILVDKITNITQTTTNEYNEYNLVKKTTASTGAGQKVIDYTYSDNPSGTDTQYYIGRLVQKLENVTAYSDTYTTQEKYTYTGNLIAQTQKKGNNTDEITESFSYDGFGNLVQKTISAPGVSSRTIKDEYDPTGRFVVKKTDADNLSETFTYNNWGQVLSHLSPLNVLTETLYDGWGKLRKVTTTGASDTPLVSFTNYERTTNGGMKVTSYNDQTGDYSVSYKDVFGQDIKSTAKGFVQGGYISKNTEYDVLGRKIRESEPYFEGGSPSQWNSIEYDDLSRPVKQKTFTGKTLTNTYNGLSATTSDGTRTKTITKDTNGNISKVTDNGETINYTYYANGSQKTANYGGHIVTTKYDGWGRKIYLQDPSVSSLPYTYSYNNYGEVLTQTTPDGTTTYTYSPTGKVLTKTVTGSNTNISSVYEYSSKGILLKETGISGGEAYSYIYTYDSKYRPASHQEITPQVTYTREYTYDPFGRSSTEKTTTVYGNLSSSVSTQSVYNSYNGILEKVKETGTGKTLWEITRMNVRMQTVFSNLGNGIFINNTIDDFGYIKEVLHTGANSTPLSLSYDFNKERGILNSRFNRSFNWNEQFTYDNFDRLVTWSDPNGTNSNTYANDGRITTNSQVGTYNYDSSARYKKTSINLNSAGDAYYAVKPRQQITYNVYKNPVEITEGSNKVTFGYNTHASRTKAVVISGTTTINKFYSDDKRIEILSKTTPAGKEAKLITWISGSPYDAPVMYVSSFAASGTETLQKTEDAFYYLHRDYQGTIMAISNEQGQTIERRLYDPWGKVVKATDKNGQLITDYFSLFTDRGYTGHEHFFAVGLIHMNGRMYDPVLRQFLSPDNYIQDPENSQNYNRYAYCVNNPLLYTDPTGEELFSAFIIAAAIKVAVTYISALNNEVDTSSGAIAKTAWMGGMSGVLSFGVGEAASGALSAATTIGKTILVVTAQATMHGMTQGFIAGISGGDFGQGFSSGFLSSGAASAVGLGGAAVGINGSTTFGTLFFGTVSGGVGSVLTGGNFWQGAATGLVVSLLNHVEHRMFGPNLQEENPLGGDPNPNRNWRQDKLLSKGEIEKLKEAGWDHGQKGNNNKGGGKKDLYKDEKGNVYEKPKGGNGPGEWTGHNLNDLSTGTLLNKLGDVILKILDQATGSLIRIPVIPEVIFIILDDGKINKEQLIL